MAMKAPALEDRLKSEGMEVVHLSTKPGSPNDALQTVELASKMDTSWVVVDGYHFGADYQQRIKEAGLRLMVIDDYGHAEHYYADIVLNQNLHAYERLYTNREPYTQLLLGTRYVLLRREFLKWRGYKKEIPEVARKVLVTLGGSDPDNVTLKVIQVLKQVKVDGLEAIVVVGANNPHYEELQRIVRDSRPHICLESNVANMPELMAWADVAITSGGTTCWELAFMGVPFAVVILADNQRKVGESLEKFGIAINLGWHGDLSSAEIAEVLARLIKSAMLRIRMAQRGQQLVDGEGPMRVLMQIKAKMLKLRPVQEKDCKLIWEWANDPDVRAVSFSPEPIPWEQHVKWFQSKISSSNCKFYIAMDGNTPIGQVRYDIEGNEAVISISIDRRFRGKGYGSSLIWRASKELFASENISLIHAYVKLDNEASSRAFVKAGFRKAGTTIINGQRAIHLVVKKEDLAI
jgi:UDP-2,4-diacetamido-2,4,6-trideoxy-beta-L-altropyranose hydrolase